MSIKVGGRQQKPRQENKKFSHSDDEKNSPRYSRPPQQVADEPTELDYWLDKEERYT